jgi:hypothetical protein
VPCTQLLEELRICACIVTSKAWSSSAMMTRGRTDRCRARPAANVAKAKARLEEDRLDGAEKGASSAIAGPRNITAAPNVSPDCTRRRAVARRVGGRPAPVSGGGRSFWVKSYDLCSRRLGRAAPLVAHQQGHYNARQRRGSENATKQWHILRHCLPSR